MEKKPDFLCSAEDADRDALPIGFVLDGSENLPFCGFWVLTDDPQDAAEENPGIMLEIDGE